MDISNTVRAILSTLHLMLTQEMREIRVRIRATRLALGWSLAEFEIHSAGAITAVAMGSYERGARALSIAKLLTICKIFELPLIHFLAPAKEFNTGDCAHRHIYDLRALQRLPNSSEKAHLLSYIQHIIRKRGDWKGAVVSLRATDIQNLEHLFVASQEIKHHNYQAWLAMQGISVNKN